MSMQPGRIRIVPIAFLLSQFLGLSPAWGAVKIRKPILEEAPPPVAAPVGPREEETFFVGTVIFAKGNQIVAEIAQGARENERLILYDRGLRRRGKAVVVKSLEKGVYLLQPLGSVSATPGGPLARESETEAVARVVRENRLESYLEFLDIFPESSYRPRISREMFRLEMKSDFPTFPGTVIEGRVRLTETAGREVPLSQILVVLDRFVIARTDEKGRFRIEGIPRLETPVRVTLKLKDPKFQMAQEAFVELPAETFGELRADLSVRFTPTFLSGQVVDERGSPLPGAEVWTDPYSMEVLTDDAGAYRVSRRKASSGVGAPAADEPLFGGEYQVYAYRKGYSVGRTAVSAESYRDNSVPSIRLVRQDAREEDVPDLGLDLRGYLELYPVAQAGEGTDPKLNP